MTSFLAGSPTGMASPATPPTTLLVGSPYPTNPAPAEPGVTRTDVLDNITRIEIPDPANVTEWYVQYQNIDTDSNLSPEQGPFGPADPLSIGGVPGEYLIVGRSVLTDLSEVVWELRWTIPEPVSVPIVTRSWRNAGGAVSDPGEGNARFVGASFQFYKVDFDSTVTHVDITATNTDRVPDFTVTGSPDPKLVDFPTGQRTTNRYAVGDQTTVELVSGAGDGLLGAIVVAGWRIT